MPITRSITFAIVAGALLWPLAQAQDVRIGATITGEVQPGVYGEVQFGSRPPPPVLYAQPVIVEPAPQAQEVAPIYLHVPPEHAHHWREHCREYRACNRPVYFVRSAEYEPGYREHGHHEHEEHEHEHRHHDDDDRDH